VLDKAYIPKILLDIVLRANRRAMGCKEVVGKGGWTPEAALSCIRSAKASRFVSKNWILATTSGGYTLQDSVFLRRISYK